MARTQKDIVSYFPHDANANGGDTITVLQGRHGNDGYAFWFKLLEKLASADGHFLDCRNPIKWQLLLAKTGVNEITGVEIMNLLVEMRAIDKELWESKLIWCQKLVDNIAEVYKNRRREIPQKPTITALNEITTDDNDLTTGESTQSKLKETKVKEKKEDTLKYGQFENVLLSIDEHDKLIERFGPSTNAHIESLSIGIKSKGYKYKSHYATILNWARRDDAPGESPETPVPAPAPQNEAIGKSLDAINEIFRKDLINERDAKFLGGFQLESNVGSSRNLYRVLQCLKGHAAVNASTRQAWTEELTKLGVEV